jgi:TonB family protein
MRISSALCAALLSALCLSPTINVQAQTQPPVSSTTAPSAPAAQPKGPEEFFTRARRLNNLVSAGVPFHLKMTFVAEGNAESHGNGTYEEWWQSKDVWRKEATFGDFKYAAIKNGKAAAANATADYLPFAVIQIMKLTKKFPELGNSPSDKKIEKSLQKSHLGWKVSKVVDGSQTLDQWDLEFPCVSKIKQLQSTMCNIQYELSSNGFLRSERIYDLLELRENSQPFGNGFFPQSVEWKLRNTTILTEKTVSLEALPSITANLFDVASIPRYSSAFPSRISPREDIASSKIIYFARPDYPKSERKSHRWAVVVVACTINLTGGIQEPFVLRSGGDAFDQAALQAARKSIIQPVRVDGHPEPTSFFLTIYFRPEPKRRKW